MDKQTFLAQLRKGLSGFPQGDIEERLTFYSEMIDDRMEEGLSEEEAVRAVGTVPEIVAQIVMEIPSPKIAKQTRKAKRRLNAWQIVLIVLGAPIWLSLAVAAAAVVLSVYISLWAVLISLWAVFGSLIGCAFGGVVGGAGLTFGGNGLPGIAMIGAGMVCAGLAIFMYCACDAATKGILMLTKKTVVWIKTGLMKKGEA